MPWCPSCRADFSGEENASCPKCGARAQPGGGGEPARADLAPPLAAPAAPPKVEPAAPPVAKSTPPSRPAHLAVLDGGAAADAEPAGDRQPKRRLVSSAGPALPVRSKQVNDSVPSSWMSRLEAAKVVTSTPPEGSPSRPPEPRDTASRPPPLKPQASAASTPPKKNNGVGKPAHLLIAELEAEEKERSTAEAERVAALFAEDKHDEIAKVQILIKEEPRKKKIPDWAVAAVLIILVVAAVGVAVVSARKEPGPSSEIDPAVAAAAEKKRQAIAALEEGHRLALEGKSKADEALAAYSRAIELDPTLASAERGLAITYAAKNDDSSAVEHYRKYLSLSPNASDAADVRKIIDRYEKRKTR